MLGTLSALASLPGITVAPGSAPGQPGEAQARSGFAGLLQTAAAVDNSEASIPSPLREQAIPGLRGASPPAQLNAPDSSSNSSSRKTVT